MRNDSVLGYALLGLLHRKPMSGYELRNVFATTAMGGFSDSPGAIYPALRRLEARKWIHGKDRGSAGLRRRYVYRLTSEGLHALKAWLKEPLERSDVVRATEELMLKFAFTDHALGTGETARFLLEYSRELSSYILELKQYLHSHSQELPLSGRLALECGIQEYEVRFRWAVKSAAIYGRKDGQP